MSDLWRFGLAAGGVAFVVIQLVVGTQLGIFPVPGGDALLWDRVGDELRSGSGDIYRIVEPLTSSFVYAPPWAVIWAALSWLPPPGLHLVILGAKIVALRIIGGSWTGAGIACWFPLVAFDLGSGAFNLVIAAAIVLAVGRRPELAVATAFAKLSPMLAIHPRDWRAVAVVVAAAVVVTLPFLSLWPAWIERLISMYGVALGPQVPVPFAIRFGVALALLATRRPAARALAAAIAIPALYWGSLVILVAPLAVWLRHLGGDQGQVITSGG